jgi:hypothetical protein
MRTEIKSENLLNLVNDLIKEHSNQSDEFKAGMNVVLKNLQDYIKGPPFVLKEEFKNLALKEFLNNDESQIPVFSNLIELFEIKMGKIGRKHTWEVYPEDMNEDVTNMLKECFAGVNFKNIYTDFDRQAVTINISVQAKSKDNSDWLNFSGDDDYLRFAEPDYEDEDEDEEEGVYDYDEISKFNRFLKTKAHYETLFLLGCLKTMFKYIDAQKVQELLTQEKQ